VKELPVSVSTQRSTSPEALKDTLRRYFAAMDRQDFAGVAELLAPDYRGHFGGNPEALDVQGMRDFAMGFFAALANVEHRIEGLVAEDTQAAARITVHGRHVGTLMGVPATGKAVVLPALDMFRFEDGRIAEQWIQFDSMGLMAQLGALPQPAT
jgi:steroid delta-isomerase-like uncharacterized protein